MEGATMKFICMNPYKLLFRSWHSEPIGFLLSYSCARRAHFTPASQLNAAILTLIRIRYHLMIPNLFHLFLDFAEKFPHSIFQTNTYDD